MTSARVRHARGASRGEGYGMVVFAAVLLGMLGIFNIIDGIAAIARSSVWQVTHFVRMICLAGASGIRAACSACVSRWRGGDTLRCTVT